MGNPLQDKLHIAFVGFGSNLGDSMQVLAAAWIRLGDDTDVKLIKLSSPFLSDPVGMDSDRRFTNCVGRIETSLAPGELLELLLKIEKESGRTRSHPAGEPEDRILDLDLLYYGTDLIHEKSLVVPHPQINKRLFVLLPMVEIEKSHVDPETGESLVLICRDFYEQMRNGTIEEQKIERSEWDESLFPGVQETIKII